MLCKSHMKGLCAMRVSTYGEEAQEQSSQAKVKGRSCSINFDGSTLAVEPHGNNCSNTQ